VTLLPSANDAEDVLQETVTVLWRKFGEFRPSTNFYAWACRTAEFKVREYRRRKSAKEAVLDQDVFERLVAIETCNDHAFESRLSALRSCLEGLKPVDRELVDKVYAHNGRGKDVAAELNRPVNSVYQSLSRIRTALLHCVERRLSAEAAQGGRT
jgi:RNA polymerase sigma-70 factor (ECF subfamily)